MNHLLRIKDKIKTASSITIYYFQHIYVHVPPPDDEQEVRQQQIQAATPQKHYKIIFIKAPSAPSVSQQAIQAAQAQNSEKTLIYVLVKKPEEINYEQPQQSVIAAPVSKPEVYFIKYKVKLNDKS